MRLTTFTEYSLRVLVYLAQNPDRFVTIRDIAQAEAISANHLMKVVQHLAGSGEVLTLRGPRGGLRLGRPAETIRLGDVVRHTEPDAGPKDSHAVAQLLVEARTAFMNVLDGVSVADLAARSGDQP
jgi:Rrf2 family transcriptional regulator, nitric oxide-sensitive transcriptional repressor